MNKRKIDSVALIRVIKMLREAYPVLLPAVLTCIILASIMSALPSVFQQRILADIEIWFESGDWTAASKAIFPKIIALCVMYGFVVILMTIYSQLMAKLTQGFLNSVRKKLFNNMQDLPIAFFDTNKHGDIMSRYTNDVDTLRMLVSQTLPTVLQTFIVIVSIVFVMLYYSVWLTLVVAVGVVLIVLTTMKVGGGSAKYFVKQQRSVGLAEGFVQEMLNGQKVIKVFNHEDKCIEDFDKLNENLFNDSFRANAYANVLGPIINNIGNVLYVLIALVGGSLVLTKAFNPSLSMLVSGSAGILTIDAMIPFLGMARQFTGNFNSLAQQINSIAMASAGAGRVLAMIDEAPETDEGRVTLVNVKPDDDGAIHETEEHTRNWAWKVPDGIAVDDDIEVILGKGLSESDSHEEKTFRYVRLAGDIELKDVDFAYDGKNTVLRDINIFAKPGQKIAFVGATGAGKTTITNLINRFYDIEVGGIEYDGIDIKDISKKDLRRSLGLVLQDTNLFTGTVMDNIRYGKLDATEEECREAARLAGADDFIERLPDGYDTVLTNNGDNLSQGQRQLIAIARAAVADPPVMILDEATSSIDTRTEQIVQRGMDKLMEGRTVFVIAHRLSTVKNSEAIIVLDHGRIIERGTHEQLLEQKGQYYQLYTGAFELE